MSSAVQAEKSRCDSQNRLDVPVAEIHRDVALAVIGICAEQQSPIHRAAVPHIVWRGAVKPDEQTLHGCVPVASENAG